MANQSPIHELTEHAGAHYVEQAGWSIPAHFGAPLAEYRQARDGTAIFDLSNRGKVEVSGKDAASFLHNLCTNDITGMPLGAGCEAFFCTNRAKVVGHALIYHLRIAADRNAFWLDLAPGENEKLIKHLDRFIIAEQVELADRTAEFAQAHLAGPNARAVLVRALADTVPDLEPFLHMERTFGANVHTHIRRHDPLGLPGYDLVCRKELAPGLWRMLTSAGATPAGLDAYELLRVEAGTPVYGVDIDENRFAFEVGRTPLAISYEKGCYLGQEPIVMARDRAGHAPRTLTGLTLTGNDPAPRAAKIQRDGQEVGWITSSIRSPKLGQPIALAYLRYGNEQPGTVVEVEGFGRGTVVALPFA